MQRTRKTITKPNSVCHTNQKKIDEKPGMWKLTIN